MDLFAFSQNDDNLSAKPLAASMRPQSFDQFLGQNHLKGLITAWKNSPHSLILWGPPGTGKTTLAHLLANFSTREVYHFNAVTAGVPELKKIISEILDKKKSFKKESVLFIDEIHRFNKSQQDALLPYIENGDFLFFGATTEYPQTSLNRALLSRVRLWELKSLHTSEIEQMLTSSLIQMERSDLGKFIGKIAEFSNGDARLAFNMLSVLAGFSPEELKDENKALSHILTQIRLYDKDGSRHYDVISAFIKSIRGSDPDAALLWLAIMLDGGEDPEFIARRLMILASEDVGLANSQGLQVAANAHYVVKNIGMPEARITLSHATIFLALAPKSNSAYVAINSALEKVKELPTVHIPGHLSNQSANKDYLYPHDYSQAWVKQDYFPKGAKFKFYTPKEMGSEKQLIETHLQRTKS